MNRAELFPLLLQAYHEHRAQRDGLLLALASLPRTNPTAERFVLRACLSTGETPPAGALTGPREILWRAWSNAVADRSVTRRDHWKTLRLVLQEMADEGSELAAGALRELELADPDPDPARGVAALGWAFRARVVAEMGAER
jgi:hypothetical protein